MHFNGIHSTCLVGHITTVPLSQVRCIAFICRNASLTLPSGFPQSHSWLRMPPGIFEPIFPITLLMSCPSSISSSVFSLSRLWGKSVTLDVLVMFKYPHLFACGLLRLTAYIAETVSLGSTDTCVVLLHQVTLSLLPSSMLKPTQLFL
jgi:hypothetical protein